jgi:hypothetical protein
MSEKRFDVSGITLADDGTVELNDADLIELERYVPGGQKIAGGTDEGCGSDTGCYNDLCGGGSDTGCENGIDCHLTTNGFSECTNDANCNSSQNQRCTNGYASGCMGTNGSCRLKGQNW